MAVPGFLIKNGSIDFINKQKSLFDVLSTVEKETSLSRSSSEECKEVDFNKIKMNKRKRIKRFRGKESLFKVPIDPPPRFQKPLNRPIKGRRWIKYSLADVSEYDMSNEGNAAAAFSFLKSIKDRKPVEANERHDIITKHLFKADSDNNAQIESGVGDQNPEVMKSVFKSSKLVMPEYVIGQEKKIRKSVQRTSAAEKGKEIYLDHIHMHDED